MKRFIGEWGGYTVLIAGIIILCVIGIAGGEQSEVNECHKWQEEAAQYTGFYLVQWQADQCKAHDITINAPIR